MSTSEPSEPSFVFVEPGSDRDHRHDNAHSTYFTAGSGEESWAEPRPVPATAGSASAPPPFPTATAYPVGCARLQEFVEAVARTYQVPVDVPALLSLATFGFALSRTVELAPLPDWREPVATYVLILLPSGERKSAVFAKLIHPIRTWERLRETQMALAIATVQDAVEEATQETKRKRTPRRDAPKPPSLVATESTTEAIANLLADNHERGMIAAAEGDALDVMLGRYGKPNFGLWLSGHTGDSIEIRRKKRPTLRLRRPALTVALVIQPEAASGLLASQAAAGRGLLARFLYSSPESKLGFRDLEPPSLPTDLHDWYGARLHQLLDRAVPDEPAILRFDDAANQLFLQFRGEVEKDLRSDGQFADRSAWGSKLAGAIARIAGILHGVAYPGLASLTIDAETVRAAIAWAPYLAAHETYVGWLAGDGGVSVLAKRILAWIRRKRIDKFSHNICFNALRTAVVRKAKDIDEALSLLEEHGWIRAVQLQRKTQSGPGRPPGLQYQVNPRMLHLAASQNTQNTQKTEPRANVSGDGHCQPARGNSTTFLPHSEEECLRLDIDVDSD